jgi:cyclic pyranopterin phosphate synthase
MTSNGVLLDKLAEPLATAGLDRVSISCDSLLRHRFEEMTRRDALDRVFAGIAAAARAGLEPIKINCVVIAGTNDDEVVEFARWSRRTGHEIRFIEYMPLDAEQHWERAKVAPAHTLRERIEEAFPLEAIAHGPEPATSYRFADGSPGGVGFISSVTEPFCDTCNRLRLTSEGQLRTCLFALDETDLRGPLREGASDKELAVLIREAVTGKWAGHRINHPDFVRPEKSMSMIGG